jgi:hypothetical protein
MTVKKRIIEEIEGLPAEKMPLIRQFLHLISEAGTVPRKRDMRTVRRLRKALASCGTPLSEEILAARSDRI